MTVMDTPADAGRTDHSDTDFCDPRVYDDPYALYAWLRDQDSLHRDDANDLCTKLKGAGGACFVARN